jgi:hypothetical protein
MSCPCDLAGPPKELVIAPGLALLPRQIDMFGGFRRQLLAASDLPEFAALAAWKGDGDSDLGKMLLEMAAYVFDVLAFYDQVYADESYVRTAQLPTSLRRLMDLIGYRAKPAVAARVELAVQADGRQKAPIPAGTAFRSIAFAGNPPEVFEMGDDASAWSFFNKLPIAPSLKALPADAAVVTLRASGMRALVGDLVLVGADNDPSKRTAAHVVSLTPRQGDDGGSYIDARLDVPPRANGFTEADQRALYLQRPGSAAKVWTSNGWIVDPVTIWNHPVYGNAWIIYLDTLYRQLNPNDWVILDAQGSFAAGKVLEAGDITSEVQVGSATTPAGAVTSTANVPLTWLWVQTALPLPADGGYSVVVRFGWSRIAANADETAAWLAPGDPLSLSAATLPPDGSSPARLALSDVNATAVAGAATVDLPNRAVTAFTPDGGAARPSLQLPVTASGNLLSATRGESVLGEVLGSGDASLRDQSFVLQKKPLTYLPDPNGPGLVSSLKIWVNGVAWREAPTLYNVAPGTPVYMVRTDIDGAATITFPLLPTGAGNVVANYRFGAGAAAPPAGAVRQIARPTPGVLSVSNPLAAYGGQDAEAPNRVRRYGPRTALQLGRAVSLADMEAIAAGTPGVRAARATWTWSRTMQRPLAHIAYVGAPALAAQIYQSLTGSMDPATPVEVVEATVVTVVLSMQVSIDPDYVAADVLAALRAVLCADLDGMLVAENVGIGQPLYRSRILAAAVAVPGVTGVTALNWNAAPFDDYGETPGDDGAFDFIDTGDVVLNGGGLHG